MNKITTFFTCLLLGLIVSQSTAQVLYSEDFDNTNLTFPTNLTVIDGDAAAANANVAAFDSWTLALNNNNVNDTVAAVTSWLDPAGAANDWMITPLVSGITANTNLSWEAAAYDANFRDGYEVWVTTTIAGATPTIADFTTNGATVFTIAAEDTLFTPHTVSLAAYAGQSIYVAFRNNSNDQFILGIDDILIENVGGGASLAATTMVTDASCGNANGSVTVMATGGAAPYFYLWSNGQTTSTINNLAPGTYGVTVTDNAANTVVQTAIVGAVGTVNLYSEDFDNTNLTFPTNLTVIDGDAAAANANVAAFDSWTLALNRYDVNDTVAAVTSWLDPAGAANDWMITPLVSGITANTNLSWEAAAYDANFRDGYEVWVTTTIAGATPTIADFTTNGATVFTIAAEDTLFTPHTVSLAAYAGQSIYVAFRNNSNDQFILAVDDISIDAACPSANLAINVNGTDASCGNANGSATASVTGGTAPYTYVWSNNQTTATISNLTPGTYGVTVTDNAGNTANGSVVIGNNTTTVNLYAEDFDNTNLTFPTNITVIDGDAAGPNANVAAFDNWTLALNRYDVNDTVAAVTSWLDPAGASNDWMITPLVTGITASTNLSWEAAAYDPTFRDGYEVWVTTTIAGATPTIADFTTNGATVFTIAAEDTLFTPHTVSLAAYAGQSIYVAFRNNSNDQFILAVDDISIDAGCPSASLAATVTVVNATCGNSNGSATVTATGGTTPYTYQWDANANNQTTATASNLAPGIYSVTVTDNAANTVVQTATVSGPATVISASASVTSNYNGQDVSCFGSNDGQATASATGGTLPYTYLWGAAGGSATTAVLNNLSAGTYPVTVIDNDGCTATASVTVTEPTIVVATIVDNNDGTATVTGSGGTAGYTYLWSNGQTTATATGLTNGTTYNATVTDANGCTGSGTVIISISALNTTVNTTNATCGFSNGTATVTVSNGATPYTYLWDANANNQTTATATNLAAGTYTVTVSDNNGTTATATAIVTANPTVNVTASVVSNYNGEDITCFGAADGAITAVATSGTSPYAYSWNNGPTTATITGLPAGVYVVTVTDGDGCTASTSVTVTEPSLLTVNAVGNGNGTATATATGGTGAYNYVWSNGQFTATATGLMNGVTYSVSATDANGCLATDTVNTTFINVNALELSEQVTVYPNPTASTLWVNFDLATANTINLRLMSTLGQEVITRELNGVTTTTIALPVDQLPAGVYALEIKADNRQTTFKVVIE